MNVPSYDFLGFAAAAALLINLSVSPVWRRYVLLVANILFFLSFSRAPQQLAPFAVMLIVGFASVKILERCKSKALVTSLVILMLILFCWLKQYTFLPPYLFLTFSYMTVGMSYVFFRMMHLIVDAYQDTLPERVGLLSYINFTLNFTCLVSGPIQFYSDYRRTETVPAPATVPALCRAAERIVAGFFKVSILSPLLSFAHQHALTALGQASTFEQNVTYGLAAVAIFPIYLYINFSGYMDFVIGVARFLRLELPENFDRPFLAKGYIEFWGRWHMTLSNWLKTYAFSPIMMTLMRRFPSPEVEPLLGVIAYFLTFFLVGAWHGQTAMFLMFGILQGLGVSINKLYQFALMRRLGRKSYRALCLNQTYAAFSRGLTFTWFAFSLLWFWAMPDQLKSIARTLGPGAIVGTALCLLLCATLGLAILERLDRAWHDGSAAPLASSWAVRTAWSAFLVVITVSITVVLNAPAPHIVYKAF